MATTELDLLRVAPTRFTATIKRMVHIAVIGDVHRNFDAADVAHFNQSDYDLLLFVGDLANYWPGEGVRVARIMARLQKPAIFLPGNHDAVPFPQLVAEIKQWNFWLRLLSRGQEKRAAALQKALGDVTFAGYSTHPFIIRGLAFDVAAVRPYSLGGPRLSFRPYLQRTFGVHSLEASAAEIERCVDEACSDQLIFLGHCGPTGLGARRGDI